MWHRFKLFFIYLLLRFGACSSILVLRSDGSGDSGRWTKRRNGRDNTSFFVVVVCYCCCSRREDCFFWHKIVLFNLCAWVHVRYCLLMKQFCRVQIKIKNKNKYNSPVDSLVFLAGDLYVSVLLILFYFISQYNVIIFYKII